MSKKIFIEFCFMCTYMDAYNFVDSRMFNIIYILA